MVYLLLQDLGWPIEPDFAELLLAAIITDTGRFQYQATSPETMRIAADLLEAGAVPSKITQNVYEKAPFGYLKAAGAALERAQIHPEEEVVSTIITEDDLDEAGVDWGDIAGAMSVLAHVPGCEVVPTFLARAISGAPIVEGVFRVLLAELLASLEAAMPVDGVLLVLHGAMMSQETPDATGEVLAQVRALVGPDVPVVGTLDLHANVTAQMVAEATALIGYHTAPHVDMYETGQKAAQVLVDTLSGRIKPAAALVRLPMLPPPEETS